MKKPEIKYVGWCHECKCMGSFICGNCKPNKNVGVKNEILRLLLFMH